jgi:putative ABC transport system substrate-binding protein
LRRRDFTTGLFIASAVGAVRGQEPAKQRRIAIVVPAGPVDSIKDTALDWQPFFEELRRLGDVEGQNLTIERYSGEGRPERYGDLAREVVNRNPDVIIASTNAVAQAVRTATGTIPIVWVGGDPIQAGFATSLARPGGNVTGVTVNAGNEIWGKRLQILTEISPSASKVAYLGMRSGDLPVDAPEFREASRRLHISLIGMPLQEATPAEFYRVFAEIAQDRPDAIIVSSIGTLVPYHKLIVDLVEKSRLPAIFPWRAYVDAGGLMAYRVDPGALFRRMANDEHEVLDGAKPADIPIYQPTKYEFLINLKAAKALELTIPPALLAIADEVIE